MFFKKEKEFVVVEVEKPRPSLDPEAKASAASLLGHPGFKYILDLLKLERSKLETTLKFARHDDIKDVEFLQSGIYWTAWVEKKLQSLNNEIRSEVRSKASQDEREIFEAIHANIETIG